MRVLDIACASGELTAQAARAVGATGSVIGIDISEAMLHRARQYAARYGIDNVEFVRMDAECLEFEAGSFDAVLCSLGLMYVPDVNRALNEMRRVLAPGGQLVFAVWGRREACGWAGIFDAIQAEVKSDVCPLFFALGRDGAAAKACSRADLQVRCASRLVTTLSYADATAALEAATIGGPVALAWSRFGAQARQRVAQAYLATLIEWSCGAGYQVPAEFVIVFASAREEQDAKEDRARIRSRAPCGIVTKEGR
jgi:ubiquinone/menaquinone biosynthesis C-methylase UbiE